MAPDLRFTFEPLGNEHDRVAFRSGIEALDSYLQKQARQDIAKRAAVAFVATLDGKTITGYYTLTQYAIDLGEIPETIAKKLPKYSTVPATLLGRLARHLDFYKQGLGKLLLTDALRRSLDLTNQAPSTGVIVDAKDDKAADFYRRYQFIDLPKVERRLFLPMGTIEQLVPQGKLAGESVSRILRSTEKPPYIKSLGKNNTLGPSATFFTTKQTARSRRNPIRRMGRSASRRICRQVN